MRTKFRVLTLLLIFGGYSFLFAGERSGELDPAFEYGEPTVVNAPDMTLYKQNYSFIESNIRVSCTYGSITDGYFNCNAGYQLTFEATQPIKALAVKGYVRAGFEAAADHGQIEYCSDIVDVESDPVLLITDIDAASVTISCIKQLRCYSVRFYFDENPEVTVCGSDEEETGEVFFLNFNAADAVYESELSEDEGKPNYSIFLYNAGEDYPFIALDIYPEQKDVLEGVYNSEDETLGWLTYYQYGSSDDYAYSWMWDDGAVAIVEDGDEYMISGYITCDDYNTYNFNFSGVMNFYTDTEYYQKTGLDNTASDSSLSVRKILRDGRIYIFRDGRTYTVTGLEMK